MGKLRALFATPLLVLATFLGLVGASAAPALAAFPGQAKLVAFGYQGGVWTINPNVHNARPIRLGAGQAPRWSPNGKQIAFERQSNIYVMNANGSGVSKLTSNGTSHEPAWSPDGKKLVFVVVQHPHGDLFTMPATGGKRTRLTNDAATSCGNDRPTWSPTAGVIAFRNTPSASGGCGLPRIRTVNVTTLEQSAVVDGNWIWGPPDISANGQRVLAVRHSNCAAAPVPCTDDIISMNRDGSHQQLVLKGEEGVELPYPVDDLAASPSGGFPTFVVYQEQSGPQREPCGLSHDNQFSRFFTSMTSCPSLPDWQP